MRKKNISISVYIFFVLLLSCSQSRKGTEELVDSSKADEMNKVDSNSRLTDTVVNYDLLVNEYEDPEREKWQNPQLVLEKLGDTKNKVVADVGAGTGYFTFPLAAVSKKVIAIDIESTFLDYIEDLKQDYPWSISEVIETRLSEENDPMLRKNEVDIVLMVNVYAYLNNRVEYLKKVKKGLKEGGVVFVVDFKKGDIPVGPEEELKVSLDTVASELKDAGYTILEADNESLQYQYIIKAK